MGAAASSHDGVEERQRIKQVYTLIQQTESTDHRKWADVLTSLRLRELNRQAWLASSTRAQLMASADYVRRLYEEHLALSERLMALEQRPRPAVLPPFPHRTPTPEEQEAAASRRLAREAEECSQASSTPHSSPASTLPDSCRSLNDSTAGSSIGSDEDAEDCLQPGVWAMGSQDGKEPLLPGVLDFGSSEVMGSKAVQELLLPGRLTSSVRKRLHRGGGMQQQ